MSPWDSRKNNFDLLRLLFALLVIYSHAFPLGTGSEVREPFLLFTHGQVTGGAVSVDAFFIISGFLIAASAERSTTIYSFLKKRILRIYPAFVVSALISAVLVLPFSGGHLKETTAFAQVWDFTERTLRLLEFSYKGAFPANRYPGVLNGSVWSIPYEFLCYLGVAFLVVSRVLSNRWTVLTLFVAAWLTGVAFRVEGWVLGGGPIGLAIGPPQFWARLLPLYLAGVVFYLFRAEIPLRNWLAALAAGALFAGCWLQFGWSLLFPVAGTYLLLWLAFTPLVKVHHVGRFGDFSYGTYLYAFPIEQLLVQRFGLTGSPLQLFCWAAPATLLAAVASWYGVERRFLAPARRRESVAQAVREDVRQAVATTES